MNKTDKKKDRPFVFVRCLTYNHEKYIEDALKGFVMQKTDFSFLAVVIDDCSTDGTADIVRRYEAQYPDIIKGIYLPHNFRSRGEDKRPYYQEYVDRATYWAECEGDDYWTDPYKLQKQVDFMETNPECGLCYTDYNLLEDATQTLTESMFEHKKQYRPISYEQHLLKPGYLAPMTWLYRCKLTNLLSKAKIYTDGTYAYMLEFLYNSKVVYIPQATAVYRSHAGSASSPIGDKALFRYTIGVFRTQIHYTQKYSCSEELKHKVLMRGYLSKLPIAIMAENEDFLREAKMFMEAHDMDIDLIIRELKQGEMKRKSYAYRLGKKLLKPISWLRNKRK